MLVHLLWKYDICFIVGLQQKFLRQCDDCLALCTGALIVCGRWATRRYRMTSVTIAEHWVEWKWLVMLVNYLSFIYLFIYNAVLKLWKLYRVLQNVSWINTILHMLLTDNTPYFLIQTEKFRKKSTAVPMSLTGP